MPVDGVVQIRGRSYNTVAKRINDFRRVCTLADGWGICTDIVHVDSESVIVKAEITSPDGRIVAMGHAEEVRAASKINQTSAVENCESSAIGRALAAAGFGGSEYASADEVQRAIAQQEQRAEEARRWSDKQRAAFCAKLGDLGLHYDDVARWCELRGRPRPSVMPADQRRKLLEYLSRGDRSAEIHAVLEGK